MIGPSSKIAIFDDSFLKKRKYWCLDFTDYTFLGLYEGGAWTDIILISFFDGVTSRDRPLPRMKCHFEAKFMLIGPGFTTGPTRGMKI